MFDEKDEKLFDEILESTDKEVSGRSKIRRLDNTNKLRLLPNPGSEFWHRKVLTQWYPVTPTKSMPIRPLTNVGKDCPSTKFWLWLGANGYKEQAYAIRPQITFYVWAIDRTNEQEGKQPFEIKPAVVRSIKTKMKLPDYRELVQQLYLKPQHTVLNKAFDPGFEGLDITITKVAKGTKEQGFDFDCTPNRKNSLIAKTVQESKAILDSLVPLDSVVQVSDLPYMRKQMEAFVKSEGIEVDLDQFLPAIVASTEKKNVKDEAVKDNDDLDEMRELIEKE